MIAFCGDKFGVGHNCAYVERSGAVSDHSGLSRSSTIEQGHGEFKFQSNIRDKYQHLVWKRKDILIYASVPVPLLAMAALSQNEVVSKRARCTIVQGGIWLLTAQYRYLKIPLV